MVMPQWRGYDRVSDLHMQKKWWLRPMWPDWSWKRRDAWCQSSPMVRCKYFLEGAELSIVHSRLSFSEVFPCTSICSWVCLSEIDGGLRYLAVSIYEGAQEKLSLARMALGYWLDVPRLVRVNSGTILCDLEIFWKYTKFLQYTAQNGGSE